MVEFVQYDPDTHARMLGEFLRSTYPNPDYVMHSARFLRWQYLDNPANETGEYALRLVVHQGQIIGQLGVIPVRVRKASGEVLNGASPVNLMVRTDSAAMGFGALLLRDLLRRTPCVINPGSSLDGLRLCTGLGMSDRGSLTRFVRVLDADGARVLHRNGVFVVGVDTTAATSSDCHTGTVLPSDLRLAFMPDTGVLRDAAYLQWRYADHPAFDYLFAWTETLDAVLVFRLEDVAGQAVSVCRIVDHVGSLAGMAGLLKSVAKYAVRAGAVLIDFYCSLPERYAAEMSAAGYVREDPDADANFASLLQPLDFRKSRIRVLLGGKDIDAANCDFHLTKGDSDQDRPNSAKQVDERG